MSESNKSYRIRTIAGQDGNLTVNLDQSYDVFEVLSIKIKQEDTYRLHSSNYGVIVGRVIANDGFGVPNAKVSVFIKGEYDASYNTDVAMVYPYQTTASQGSDGIVYNLLPDNKVDDCHQVVGTFPNKTYMLDNDVLIDVFDDYYKYTTRTNNSGDYIICGVPVGQQTIHMDLDLSDCGILSQRPRDFVYKGYTIEQFENPNQFKTGSDLDSLSQIFRQDTVVNVIPFWGNEALGETIGITRADIKINFKFEPTCVFMGSLVADNSSNGVSKKCVPTNQMGSMDELTTGEGTIEMIRKTPNGDTEEFQIRGTQLIDGNGVWCYQIPMNLDYMMTDEYGNMVPTDDPTKGIPTRARVRFRISMNDSEQNVDNYFRAKVLVPHNPQNYFSGTTQKHEDYDYEFGTYTKDESFRDLFWNNVYTVKSYIPRFQKSKKSNTDRFTGIKHCNIYGQNNPMPYNNIRIKMPFMFILLCAMIKTYVRIVYFINGLTDFFVEVLAAFSRTSFLSWPERKSFEDRALGTNFTVISDGICPDLDNWYFAPTFSNVEHETWGTQRGWFDGWVKKFTTLDRTFEYLITNPDEEKTTADKTSIDISNKSEGENSVCLTINTDYLMSCIEMNLAQEYKVINFDFYNDWVNGVIYMPRWMRFVRKKRTFLFGLIKIKPKVKSCADDSSIFGKTRYYTQQCALTYGKTNGKFTKITTHNGCMDRTNDNKQKCHKLKGLKTYSIFGSGSRKGDKGNGGIIHESQTIKSQYVYYFKPCEWRTSTGKKTILFANDIVLLGSLNDCNLYGIPQAFKYLTNSSYVMPTNLALTNMDDDGYLYADSNGTICSEQKNIRTGVTQLEPSFENEQTYWGPSAEENVSYGTNGNDDVDTLNYDDTIPITEAAGIAWNYSGPGQGKNSTNVTKELYYPGGHFLGISCTNSQTNIKSCVNLQRICEIGTTESQRREEVRRVSYDDSTNKSEVLYRYYVPTGLIAQDEINASDFRSMFATMNHKRLLCTNRLDEKTGYPIYDFVYMRPIGFDGVLMDRVAKASEYNDDVEVNDEIIYMKSQGVSLSDDYDSEEQRQTKRRTIEEPSDDYYMFRLGLNTLSNTEQESKFLYSQSNSVSMPQYENSYYFYFGLKDGATALDEFNKQFFSVCDSKSVFVTAPVIFTNETFNSCGFDLSLTVTVENMESPVSVTIKNRNTEQTVSKQDTNNPAVCTFSELTRGTYEITATDNDGKYVTATVQVGGNSISMETSTKDFEFRTKNITNPRTIINSGKTLNCGYIYVGSDVTLYGSDSAIPINNGVVLVLVGNDLKYVTSNGSGITETTERKIKEILGVSGISYSSNYESFVSGETGNKFHVWSADASYNLFVIRTGECSGVAYYDTFVVNGCDNYDIYLGSKYLSYSSDLHPLVKSSGVLEWFNDISGTTKEKWAMRHYLFRQTDNDDATFKNKLIALNNNGREIDTALFGQPDYLDGYNHYRYSGDTSYYEGDGEHFSGDVSDDSIIPTWPSEYVQSYYANTGQSQGPKLHYGEMATYNGIIASDKIGEYPVEFSQHGNRVKISGVPTTAITITIVPNHYGCIVKFEDNTIVYPVRDGDSYYYYGDLPEDTSQVVSIYPVLYFPVMYRPFYAKQYVIDWISGRIDTEIEGNEEVPIPLFDCESWKSQLDIYNGITYDGKFSLSGTIVNEQELVISGISVNDLAIGAYGDGYANVRTFVSSALTDSNSSSGYTVGTFGFNIIEGSPSGFTDEEKTEINTPYTLDLASIEGNVYNDFPSYIGYKYDNSNELIFTTDNDSTSATFYLQTGSTTCPLKKDKVVYRKVSDNIDFVLCRYNQNAHQHSPKNIVGKEVIVYLVTPVIPGIKLAHISYYEHNDETGEDIEQLAVVAINTNFPEHPDVYESAVSALSEAGVDVVYTYKLQNTGYDVKSFVNNIEGNRNFVKLKLKESVDSITSFTVYNYVVAVNSGKTGEKGEVNVVRVYPHDSIQQIQEYTPPSEPYIEVVPSGTTGIYDSITENSGTTFTSEGGTLQIRVKSSTSWVFSFESGDTSWIKVNGASSYSGQNVEYLTITATPNESNTDKIVSGIAKTNVTHVDDSGNTVPYTSYALFKLLGKQPKNYIEPDTVTIFSNGGGSLGVKVISNTNENWRLTLSGETLSGETWVRFSTTTATTVTGNGNATVYLIANENRTQNTRNCNVTLDNAVGGDGRLEFSQNPTQVELTVSPLSLDFDKTGGTKYITVTCNGSWSSSKSSGAGWIGLTGESDSIKVVAGANDGASRNAVITVTSPSGSTSGVSKTVSVNQADGTNKYINTTFSTTATTFEANNIVITISSNTSWKLTKDNYATWFKFPNNAEYYSSSGNASITCSVELNRDSERTCTIQTKATALDCIPEPETTVFIQEETDYSFMITNNISSEYLIESIKFITSSDTLTYDEIYLWYGGSKKLRMFNEEYLCTQVYVSIVGGDTQPNSITFMGYRLNKNEYGKYVGNVNMPLRNNETYTLDG